MPTYVFKCPQCGRTIEKLLSLKEFENSKVDVCKHGGITYRMDIVPQKVGIAFKGSGWTPKFGR